MDGLISNSDYDPNCRLLKDLCVIVLSYNRKNELLNNIPALCQGSAETGFELIVVDNASTDGSREVLANLKRQYQNLRVLYNDKNLGVAGGRNTGRRKTVRAYVLYIDDDTRIEVDDMRRLCKVMDERPDIGVVSPRILHSQTGMPQNDHGVLQNDVGNYHGACHLVRGKSMIEVGDIDPLCVFGGEELDYSIRMRAKGYGVLYAPNVIVKHNNYPRSGEEGLWRRRMRVYNFTRLHFKHFPWYMAWVFSMRYLVSHLASGIKRCELIFAISLPRQAMLGAMEGRKQYQPIPRKVREFYLNPTLRPDFGNVPIYRKFCFLIKKRINK